MGGVLLLLLVPLVMWAIAEVLEHWASTTYLWVMGEPALGDHRVDRRPSSRTGHAAGPDVTATLQA